MSARLPLSDSHSFTDPNPRSQLPALLFLGVVGVLLSAIALGLSAPLQFIGVLAIGLSIASVAIVLLGGRYFRESRARDLDAMFDGVFEDADCFAFLEGEDGALIKCNRLARAEGAGVDGSISTVLDRMFEDGAALEHRLRTRMRDQGRSLELCICRAGKPQQLEALRCGAGNVIWSIRHQLENQRTVETASGLNKIATIRLDAEDVIGNANEAAKGLGLSDGAKLGEFINKPFSNGAVVEFSGQNGKFRGYQIDDDEASQVAFLPVEKDDMNDASPDQFLDALPVALARVANDGTLLHLNDSARKLLGEKAETGVNLNALLEGLGRSMDERIRDMMQGRAHMRTEVARGRVNGHEIFLQVTLDLVHFDGTTCVLAVMNDATELKTLEAQFVQSQKMQAVGQLAGGVAHDFNNLLTAINGHCDLILMRHETTDTDYGDLIQIRHNANRAASLVGQLLAFSRKQTLLPKVIDLYDTLSDLNHLLNRLLGEKVTLRIEHSNDIPKVRVDERQLEQVIMNLVVNARDAMPNGGEVLIQTNSAVFETDKKMDRVVIPFGTYVQIDVTDTGVGIPEDKITKIFEPFFTTKGVGEGTGLGLSTAYGIIKQTGGFIFAKSEVGAGTTFTLYLPTHAKNAVPEATDDRQKVEPTDLTGRGVVLLVEDEVPVRSFAARALNIRGYTVVEAGSAEEALEILEDKDLHVDIFVSDVIMPGMDGPTWVRMAQKDRPDTRVVFVSGYAEDVFDGGQISVPNATFLPKPFSLNELTHTVKEQLEMELD